MIARGMPRLGVTWMGPSTLVTKCRLGASTSQSANAGALDNSMKALATVVLPVPPLPLRTSSCFMLGPPG